MSGNAVFEKLPAIPRAPTKLRGFHRGTPQQQGSQPIVATTKATGQVLSIKASALYMKVKSRPTVCRYCTIATTMQDPSTFSVKTNKLFKEANTDVITVRLPAITATTTAVRSIELCDTISVLMLYLTTRSIPTFRFSAVQTKSDLAV
jgi:hypothetical protein